MAHPEGWEPTGGPRSSRLPAAGASKLRDRLLELRARYYYGALDAVYTAPTREEQPPRAFLRDAFREPSNFERVGALARYAETVAPGGVARLRTAVEDLGAIPCLLAEPRPLGYGTRSTCVHLGGSPPRVLKFLRPSLGQDVRTVARLSRQERDNYETLQRWYAGIPYLLPHTIHLVLAAPIRGVPAAAQIQELVPADARDLLGDHSDRELLDLLGRDEVLRAHFRTFVAGTRRAWDEEGRFLDMVGHWNVLLIPGPAGSRMRVADFGIWDLARQRRVRPDLWRRAADALARIERVAERAG